MARKTFISYKYNESKSLRDKILKALGEDATYYQGETSNSPDLTDNSTDSIKENLKDMIYGTSVTIVIISPNLTKSKWIDWEIEYSLKKIRRDDKTSQTNGIIGVIMKHNGGYDWIRIDNKNSCGCSTVSYDNTKLYDIITNNRHNKKKKEYSCQECKSIDALIGSYISLVTEEDFLKNVSKYIENAYKKSENDASGYDLTKQK